MIKRFNTITLRHLVIDSNKMIGLEYISNPSIQALVGTLNNVKWSEEFELSYIQNTNYNLDQIFTIFKGIAWVNCKYFYKDKQINTNISEPDYSNFKNKQNRHKRKCPDEYIDRLQV